MISLAECAPCKAMRLQQESEEEFRKRFGVVNAGQRPLQMGWKPYLGQMPVQSVNAAAAPVETATRPYLQNVQERLLGFAGGTLFGFPIGILTNVAFKSLRKYRHEAMTFAALTTGIGLLATLLPIDSPVMGTIARISGVFTGSAMADVALPRKIMAPLPG